MGMQQLKQNEIRIRPRMRMRRRTFGRGHRHFNELVHLVNWIRVAPLCIYLFALALIVFAFVCAYLPLYV